MENIDFSKIGKKEARLAKVLLKNSLITADILNNYLEFKAECDEFGKVSLWKILVERNYLSQSDLDEYIKEREKPYLDFCKNMLQNGFLEPEQFEQIMNLHKDGKEIVSALSDNNIMTRDNFLRSFVRFSGEPRLSEWLVVKGKITEEQLADAKARQKKRNFSDFLIFNGFIEERIIRKVEEKIAAATS